MAPEEDSSVDDDLELDRIESLVRLRILDTAPEERFDRLTRLASKMLDAPIGLLSLIDKDRQWSKSSFGIERISVPRGIAFCNYAIETEEPLIVPDLSADERFKDNPLVLDEPHARAYAGIAVRSPDGFRVGTICAVDVEPRPFTAEQIETLTDLAHLVESEFDRVDLAEALQRNRRLESRFEKVFARSSEALLLIDGEGSVLQTNDGISRLLGYPAGALSAENYFDFVHPDDIDIAIDLFESGSALSETEFPVSVELRLRGVDGAWRWFELWIHDLTDDPAVCAYLISARDITDHVEFAKAQEEANERLRAALEVSGNGFVEFDSSGRIVSSNSMMAPALSGSGVEIQLPGRLRHCLVDGSGRPYPTDHRPVFEAIRTGAHLRDAVFGVSGSDDETHSDGSTSTRSPIVQWVSVSTAPFMVGGEPHTILSVRDVTHVRNLEREFAQEHRRYELILENASDIFAIIDTNGRVEFASPATERILGYKVGNDAPGGLLSYIHPDDRNIIRDVFAKVVREQWDPEEPVVVRAMTETGDWVYLESMAANLLKEPAVNGILVTARDVTSREMLTQALVHQAMSDPLTGIFNRRAFGQALERSLARSRRSGEHIGLLWLDLDDFKGINDVHGHGVGDKVLIEVASRLKTTVRAGDIVGRFGGDEFAVVLEPVSGEADAISMAQRLSGAVSAPMDLGGVELVCMPSVGVAISDVHTDPESLMAAADASMYRSKRGNGGAISP